MERRKGSRVAKRRWFRGIVITPNEEIADGIVAIEGDTIAWVGPVGAASSAGWDPAGAERLTPGHRLLPGLVDVHCHGGGGVSFPDASDRDDALAGVLEHRRNGTTSLVASLVTAPRKALLKQTKLLAQLAEEGELAGIHVEGPFLSDRRLGAQDGSALAPADPGLVVELGEAAGGHLVSMTLAPEVKGAVDACLALVVAGAVPSFGHTDANGKQVKTVIKASLKALEAAGKKGRSSRPTVTHLFNGMTPLHHRAEGPIPELLAAARSGRVVVELVSDGVHLDPDLVASMFGLLGRENIMLVTDAVGAAGMPDGQYVLGGREVRVAAGVARMAESGNLAGGTKFLLDVVRVTIAAGVPVTDAVFAASVTPAQMLGDRRLGRLAAGCRADLILVDRQLRPTKVVRAGQTVRGASG